MAASAARALTLVELLAVIGIIAVLSALLLPVLGRVREIAIGVQCAGSLRQIGTASAVYADEWRGAVVPSDTGEAGWVPWYVNLADKVDEAATISNPTVGRIMRGCPRFRSGLYRTLAVGSYQWQQYSGYAESLYLGSNLPSDAAGYTSGCTYFKRNASPTMGSVLFTSLLRVSRRAERAFFYDNNGQYFSHADWWGASYYQRHNRRANVLFLDLRVVSTAPADVARASKIPW